MQISPVSDRSISNIWDLKELPPAPPMPKDSSWVKSMELLFPQATNLEELRKDAYYLMDNTMTALRHEIAREDKIHRETAQKWKDALRGR